MKLERLEYHRLKAIDDWLGAAGNVIHEGFHRLAGVIEEHEGHQCGALDVARTFTPVVMMSFSLARNSLENLVTVDDETGADGPTDIQNEWTKANMDSLFQEWMAIQVALGGLASAYIHLGIPLEIDIPPATIQPGEPRHAVVDTPPAEPELTLVPPTPH